MPAIDKSKYLPKGYRLRIVQLLDKKGIKISERQVTDVKRGHIKDPDLTKNILSALSKIADTDAKKKKDNSRIKKQLLKRA